MVKDVVNSTRTANIAAIFIMALYVIAFIGSLVKNYEIPVGLTIIMPAAAGVLLGIQLPIGMKGKSNNE